MPAYVFHRCSLWYIIKCFCLQDGHFSYSYRLRPGINHDSHGLKVARIAGVPPSAMAVATDTLAWLRERESSKLVPDYNIFLKSALKSTV
jgi:DNA mismatch repair ATPase MutS